MKKQTQTKSKPKSLCFYCRNKSCGLKKYYLQNENKIVVECRKFERIRKDDEDKIRRDESVF
jgi:hypothetical protein